MPRKQAFQGCFFEKRYAQNLENFVHAGLQAEFLFHDGYQHINADGDPYLGLHRVGCGAIKRFDPEMLLDPFEKQFDQSTTLVQPGYRPGRKLEIVGQKEEPFV